MILLRLYWEFFKTGLFAIGGGMATVPFLQEMGARTGWFTGQMLADMIAVSESTPGPIGVNMATYVGWTTAGLPGGVLATLGLITPSFLVILLVARVLAAFQSNKTLDRAFYGMRPASTGLIAAAGVAVLRIVMLDEAAFAETGAVSALLNWRALALFAVIWVLTNLVPKVKTWHPVVFIALSAAAGIAVGGI
ncbi:MAG: chromate transporter [Oscillospiraceae bacterium]|nr:chromate transporter [Oscillospiraceae bacterium]